MNTNPFVLTEARQVRALASPARSQIMEILRLGGEKSVAELARMIGASGSATHYHIGRLVETGLVVQTGKRRAGPRSEAIFRAISTSIKIPARPESPEYMEALLALAMTTIRKLEREIAAAHTALSLGKMEAPAVAIRGRSGIVRPEDLPRINALLEEAVNLVQPPGEEVNEALFAIRTFLIKLQAGGEQDGNQRD